MRRCLRKVSAPDRDEIAAGEPQTKSAAFTEARLIAEVEYRAWTDDEKLRHASYKGIRERAGDATILGFS
ncbi:hypothetical protein [Sinorhizobium meliloti]|uniref:ATP dependent DNA ligase n=1 Tax=Rhizobium meliloti TaxID=382 RepID=UPI001865918E|nr:hypothetical protein [Sinorhizobium meliloti]